MSGSMHWMPLFVGDYLADTKLLSTEEHGAYLLLIMHCWEDKSFPNDDKVICRITGLSVYKWRKHRENILKFFAKFFENNCEKFYHPKVERVRGKQQAVLAQRTEKARKAAQKRWGVKQPVATNNRCLSNALQNQNQITNIHPGESNYLTDPVVDNWGDES